MHLEERASRACKAWTEEVPGPVASGVAPRVLGAGTGTGTRWALGPLDLGPASNARNSGHGNDGGCWGNTTPSSSSLPPLAIVFDAEALHRGMAARLASRGFPMAGNVGFRVQGFKFRVSLALFPDCATVAVATACFANTTAEASDRVDTSRHRGADATCARKYVRHDGENEVEL